MSIRLDRVIYSSQHEAYKEYLTTTANIVVGADVVADSDTKNYTATIPYTRGGTRADIYLSVGGFKTLATIGSRIAADAVYEYKSSETASILISYTASSIAVTLSVFNGTGGSITLVPQTITVSVVQYDAPITSI